MLALRPAAAVIALPELRAAGPWLLRDALRAALVVILGAVSAWYLTRWALANNWPAPLAWALPIALDCAALLGIVVVRHPATAEARRAGLRLAWGAGALSVTGNAAMHALDYGAIRVTLASVIATGAVVPAMIVWGWHVAGGMARRPAGRKVGAGRPAGKDGGQRAKAGSGANARQPARRRLNAEAVEWARTEGAGWRRIRAKYPKLGQADAKRIAEQAREPSEVAA